MFQGLHGFKDEKPRTTMERRMFATSVLGDTVTFRQFWTLWGTLGRYRDWLEHQGTWLFTQFALDDTDTAPPLFAGHRTVSAQKIQFMRWEWICREIEGIGDPPYLLAVVTERGALGELLMAAPLAVRAGIVTDTEATRALHAFASRTPPCPPWNVMIRQDQLSARENEIAARDAQKIEDRERESWCVEGLVRQGLPAWLASWWCRSSPLAIVLTGVAVVGGLALVPTAIRTIQAVRSRPTTPR